MEIPLAQRRQSQSPMNARPGPFNDIRDAPAYSFLEASRHLGVPQATLRYWVLGRMHQGEPGTTGLRTSDPRPLWKREQDFLQQLGRGPCPSRPPDQTRGQDVGGSRRLTYAENSLGIRRLLLRDELSTSGQDLFLEQLGTLITLSRSGQMAMRKLSRRTWRESSEMTTRFRSGFTRSAPHGLGTSRL